MIDNCYCEFVERRSPLEVGADIMVGSLIKNLGGGIAPNGAYVAGKHELIELVGERLTCPGEGREVGPSLGINKQLLQGIYLAPSVVASATKTAICAPVNCCLKNIIAQPIHKIGKTTVLITVPNIISFLNSLTEENSNCAPRTSKASGVANFERFSKTLNTGVLESLKSILYFIK